MKIGSLFSGIGGLELGLEWAGLGHTVWQVEKEEYGRRILARHWPHAERFEDVQEVGKHNLQPVDLICGGFPCQDISSAGKGAGLAGSRSGLWFEFARIVNELRPRWVVVENVASGANRWVDAVVSGLGEQGYQALPVPLSAKLVGAPHLRRRVFIIAHTDRFNIRLKRERRSGGRESFDARSTQTSTDPRGRRLQFRGKSASRGEQGPRGSESHRRRRSREVCDGTAARTQVGAWSLVPPVRGVDDGVLSKLDRHRLKALGNSVVPQCAEIVGWMIRELES